MLGLNILDYSISIIGVVHPVYKYLGKPLSSSGLFCINGKRCFKKCFGGLTTLKNFSQVAGLNKQINKKNSIHQIETNKPLSVGKLANVVTCNPALLHTTMRQLVQNNAKTSGHKPAFQYCFDFIYSGLILNSASACNHAPYGFFFYSSLFVGDACFCNFLVSAQGRSLFVSFQY